MNLLRSAARFVVGVAVALLDREAAATLAAVAIAALEVAVVFGWLTQAQAVAVAGLIAATAAATRHFVWAAESVRREKAAVRSLTISEHHGTTRTSAAGE